MCALAGPVQMEVTKFIHSVLPLNPHSNQKSKQSLDTSHRYLALYSLWYAKKQLCGMREASKYGMFDPGSL